MFFLGLIFVALIGLLSGPIGCFILWRRLTFFGETIAHAALLGVIISFFLDIPIQLSMMFLSLFYSLLLQISENKKLDYSSFMPIYSYGLMGVSIIVIDKIIGNPSMIYTTLTGDILLVSYYEITSLALLNVAVFLFWVSQKKKLSLMIISEDMAIIKGYRVDIISFCLTFLVAVTIGFLVEGIGSLLTLSLLTTPALTTVAFCKTPNQMIFTTSFLGLFISLFGYSFGWHYNLPIGPSIGAVAMFFYLFAKLIEKKLIFIKKNKFITESPKD